MVPGGNHQLRPRAVGAPAARSALLTVLGEYVLPASGAAWQETLIGALGTLGYKTHPPRHAPGRRGAPRAPAGAGGRRPRRLLPAGAPRPALARAPAARHRRDAPLGDRPDLLVRR